MMNANDLGEDELIGRLLELVPQPADPSKRAGDDCAILDRGGDELILLKTDALVEGVHYEKGETPERIGWKAIARVISDFAACGGTPAEFLVTLAISGETPVTWLEGLYRGMARCMEKFGGTLVGGETTSMPVGSPIVISVSGVGRVARNAVVLRSGGQPGDLLAVTGRLGGSLDGKHLDFVPRVDEAVWLASGGHVKAMMDLSDGLAKDLPRLARASGCGFRIEMEKIPCRPGYTMEQALTDGEDYELLIAIPPRHWDTLLQQWRRDHSDTLITLIGELVPAGEGDELDGGWDHFSPSGTNASG